jgi:hypothetical protein
MGRFGWQRALPLLAGFSTMSVVVVSDDAVLEIPVTVEARL